MSNIKKIFGRTSDLPEFLKGDITVEEVADGSRYPLKLLACNPHMDGNKIEQCVAFNIEEGWADVVFGIDPKTGELSRVRMEGVVTIPEEAEWQLS